jgi:hypothetical protein
VKKTSKGTELAIPIAALMKKRKQQIMEDGSDEDYK